MTKKILIPLFHRRDVGVESPHQRLDYGKLVLPHKRKSQGFNFRLQYMRNEKNRKGVRRKGVA